MSLTIKLSTERGEQLRAYAEMHGKKHGKLGFGEAIGKLLRDAGAAKVAGLDIVAINPRRTAFVVALDDVSFPLRKEQVLLIADVIEGRYVPNAVGKRAVIGDKELTVRRARGNASIIIDASDKMAGTAARRVLPIDIARDFVAQLRMAVSGH